MNSKVRCMSASGSGGLPRTKEHSGTIPYSRIRFTSSSVSRVEACPPLFIRSSVSSEPDSAPMKIIFNPDFCILRHVASE